MNNQYLDQELENLLFDWSNSLIELDFVGQEALKTLKQRLINFIDRKVHFEDEDLHEFATSLEHLMSGG